MGPFASVVVPTRDRPELVRYCLESLKLQTFDDFEVIVSDNFDKRPCKEVFDKIADSRFRYLTPSSQLAMSDNWEFACKNATGKYVAVLIDKTVLRPTALEAMWEAVTRQPAEIVSWWNENYVPSDEDSGYDKGTYLRCQHWPRPAYRFDAMRELARRFKFDVRRGTEGYHYFWGKICFGAYHRNLINRIRRALGRLFFPLSPDYTSMIAALAFARSALDIGQPLLISFITRVSNGRLCEESEDYMLNFLKSYRDMRVLDRLPLRGLYASTHNVVAADYSSMREMLGNAVRNLKLNRRNLLRRAHEDLNRRIWTDESRRRDQYYHWRRAFSELGITDRVAYRLQAPGIVLRRTSASTLTRAEGFVRRRFKRFPSLRPLAAEALFHFLPAYCEWFIHETSPRQFDSIIGAAQYADKYYASLFRAVEGSMDKEASLFS